MRDYHEPVMLRAAIDALAIAPGGNYVDATFGGGGHSRLLLQHLDNNGRLYGFDQDADAEANAPDDDRFVFVPHNFRFLKRFLKLYGLREVDGILADLGVSSFQLDEARRGFSFRFSAPLDMRMNQAAKRSAAEVLNTYDAAALQDLFSRYGEVRNARSLAKRIVESRDLRPLERIEDFVQLLEPLIRGQRNRYLAQVFQALRIEVNDEMEALSEFLAQALDLLPEGGRLVVITYHSVEDRLVKNFLKTGNPEGRVQKDFYGKIFRPFRLIHKKALTPEPEEVARNPRARSAKMRVGERSAEDLPTEN